MEFVDLRELYRDLPRLKDLKRAFALLEPSSITGIREVRFYDQDPRANRENPPAYARYVPLNEPRRANIEVYFWRIEGLPDALRESDLYLVFLILRSVAHELYHHRIRGQRRLRKPKQHSEETHATKYGQKVASRIVHRLYPRFLHPLTWWRMRRAVAAWQRGDEAT